MENLTAAQIVLQRWMVNVMSKLRRWLLDLLYEEHVQCDSGIESLVDDIEQIIRDAAEED